MKKENACILMNFSGIYDLQSFYKKETCQEVLSMADAFSEVDLKMLSGTNCYCDDCAMEAIREAIQNYASYGIHFLDSGNYHYMTRIWLEKIDQPFILIVFDHHTDMQPPAFGGILSCGGWIAASLEQIPYLKRVIVVGPDQASIDQVAPEYAEKTLWYSQERLKKSGIESILDEIRVSDINLPVYFSIDKDVLSDLELKTNWNQGDMTLEDLKLLLTVFKDRILDQKQSILGMDICGESDSSLPETTNESDRINLQMLKLWSEWQSQME